MTGKPRPLPRSLAEWAARRGFPHRHWTQTGWGDYFTQQRGAQGSGRSSRRALQISPPWCSQLEMAGGSQGRDAAFPRRKAEGQSSGLAWRALTSLWSPLQGSPWPSKESEQNISTSTLIFYLSSYKAPKSGSSWSPAPWVPRGLARRVEHRASCPAAQRGTSCYHGNGESAASPCHLSDGSQAGQRHVSSPPWLHSPGLSFVRNMALLLGTIWAGCTRGDRAGDILVEETWWER